MNFRPDLAKKVLAGEKTVTRRIASPNPRSPWSVRGCALKPGRDYAVCPGRGKRAIGRVRVTDVRLEALGTLTNEEARREGFPSSLNFIDEWRAINGDYKPDVLVWRVEFAT